LAAICQVMAPPRWAGGAGAAGEEGTVLAAEGGTALAAEVGTVPARGTRLRAPSLGAGLGRPASADECACQEDEGDQCE
jgi:hypothetical protein